jgi:hypothetical protein
MHFAILDRRAHVDQFDRSAGVDEFGQLLRGDGGDAHDGSW